MPDLSLFIIAYLCSLVVVVLSLIGGHITGYHNTFAAIGVICVMIIMFWFAKNTK